MNKIVAVSSLFFVVISSVAVCVQAAEAKKPHQKAGFLQTVDTNKDGKASKAEFIAAMDRKFNSLDVDKNDSVSVQELKIYGEKDEEARRRALKIAAQAGFFEKIISKGYFLQLYTERAWRDFAMLDTNDDNVLSADEVGAGKSKRQKNAKAKNHKARAMSKDEFVGIFIENATRDFLRLDKNHDGMLTETELGVKPQIQHPPSLDEPADLPKISKPSAQLSLPHKPRADKKALQQKLIKSFFFGIDTNHDGKISTKEKSVVFDNLFKRLDTNHDQFITQDEIIAGRHTPLSVKH